MLLNITKHASHIAIEIAVSEKVPYDYYYLPLPLLTSVVERWLEHCSSRWLPYSYMLKGVVEGSSWVSPRARVARARGSVSRRRDGSTQLVTAGYHAAQAACTPR